MPPRGVALVGLTLFLLVISGCSRSDVEAGPETSAADEATDVGPVANADHWHAAFGIDICGTFQPDLADLGPDIKGIHTHQDGLIHIHPFGPTASGENAQFDVFAEQTGIVLGDGEFTLPNGDTFANGDDCLGTSGDAPEAGRVALYVWPPGATEATEPEIITEDLGSVRFTGDGQAMVLAFVPEGAEVPLPPSLPTLSAPEDMAPTEGLVS